MVDSTQPAAARQRQPSRGGQTTSPSRPYVFVVVSLALFMLALTFLCEPQIRNTVSGRVLRLSEQPLQGNNPPAPDWQETVERFRSNPIIWSTVLEEFHLDPADVAAPRIQGVSSGSAELRHLGELEVTLQDTQAERGTRLMNRYLQALVEEYEGRSIDETSEGNVALHLKIVGSARLDGRSVLPLQARQLIPLALPALLGGLAVAWLLPAAGIGKTLRTLEQVRSVSPYPVIALRQDSADNPVGPHYRSRKKRRGWRPVVKRLVRASELILGLGLALVVGYALTAADGYQQRLIQDPLSAYLEAASFLRS